MKFSILRLPTNRCEIEGISRTRWSDPGNDEQSIGVTIESLRTFLAEKYMKKLGDKTYIIAYFFLEKLRILEEKGKSEHKGRTRRRISADVIIICFPRSKFSFVSTTSMTKKLKLELSASLIKIPL